MGKGIATSGKLVARAGFKRKSVICGGESLSRARARYESARMVGKESSLKGGGIKKNHRFSASKQVKMMKRGLSDIPEDLVAKILSRVPITSLGSIRSTCKQWNTLSRNQIFGKVAEANNLFFGFVLIDTRMYSLRIDHQGLVDDDLSFKQVSVLNQVNQLQVRKAYQCDGLLLFSFCADSSRLLVWNPYLGQTRWIQYERNLSSSYALGYDNNGNHKILEISESGYSIYELSSNSWKVFDVTRTWKLPNSEQSVNLKGNTFFFAVEEEYFLLSFDFTLESFGQRLSLPFHSSRRSMLSLSRVGDKKLAVLLQTLPGLSKRFEIWITNKIDCNEVVWTKWMHVEFCQLFRAFWPSFEGFLVDEEKRVAVVFDRNSRHEERSCRIDCDEEYLYVKSCVFGEDGYCLHRYSFGQFEVPKLLSYVPSLVQIE